MSLINVRNLGVFSPRVLFRNLNLAIHDTDRIGLIASNGAGKSTLLRCLSGQTEPGMGDITRRRGLRVGLVEQDVPDNLLPLPLSEAVRRALPVEEREANAWKVGMVLDLLDTPLEMRDRALSALSGGWQRLALIARVWVTDPDVLLLDEPTNHLDLQRLAVLENWINHATDGVAMVIASHDRQFLDGCTNRTLFLRPEELLYAHPFSRARSLLADDDAARETKLARDAKEVDRLRRNAGQLRNVGINSGSDLLLRKSKQLSGRAEAIEQTLRPLEKERSGDIRLANRGTHAKVLVTLNNVAVRAPDERVLFHIDGIKIFQRDRIVVGGANGVGKSQFVRLLHRAMVLGEVLQGVAVSPTLVVGYLDQQMSQLPLNETPLGFVSGQFGVGDQRCVSLLAGAGFSVDTQRRPISALSLGQRARLGLLALRLAEPNFYLMDEPTNHVDITGQERLESEILAHEATCVLISHDRFFVRAIATRLFRIEGKQLLEE